MQAEPEHRRPPEVAHRVSSSLSGPVVPSFRALSGRLNFTVRRHKFNKDSLFSWGGSYQRFRGGLAFKAHRLLYHSTLGLRVIKKKKEADNLAGTVGVVFLHLAVWKVDELQPALVRDVRCFRLLRARVRGVT